MKQHALTHTVFLLLLSIGFAIPISNALTNILIFLALITILFIKNSDRLFNSLNKNPIALTAMGLFMVILLGISYTAVSLYQALEMLVKYRELLYIPLLIILFQYSRCQHWALWAFMLAMLATLILSYFIAFGWEELGKGNSNNPFVFKNHITQGILMALFAYFLAIWALHWPRWRIVAWSLCGLAVFNVLLMTQGRSGYLIFACLFLLLIYHLWQWRGLIFTLLIALISIGTMLLASNTLQNRLHILTQDIRDHQAGLRTNSNALRYDFLRNSSQITLQSPLIGHGTGSFKFVYQEFVLNHAVHRYFSENPHNEYLMIAVQWGGLGLLLWLLLLFLLWRNTCDYPPLWQWQARGFVLAIIVGSLVNSLLLDTTEGHLFAYLTALFFSFDKKNWPLFSQNNND
jgi:O-antigen ligase